jgi:hypothetical protein
MIAVPEAVVPEIKWSMPDGWYEDTDPEALEVFLRLHRQMTPGQRVARVFELTAFQERLQRASVRAMYPNASEREVFLRVAARRLDRDTMLQVYGWDPDLRP